MESAGRNGAGRFRTGRSSLPCGKHLHPPCPFPAFPLHPPPHPFQTSDVSPLSAPPTRTAPCARECHLLNQHLQGVPSLKCFPSSTPQLFPHIGAFLKSPAVESRNLFRELRVIATQW